MVKYVFPPLYLWPCDIAFPLIKTWNVFLYALEPFLCYVTLTGQWDIKKWNAHTKTSKMFAHWDFFCFASSRYNVNKSRWMCCRMRNQYPNHPRCRATGCVSKSNPWSPTKSWAILSGCHFKSLRFGVVLMVQQIIQTSKWSWVLV